MLPASVPPLPTPPLPQRRPARPSRRRRLLLWGLLALTLLTTVLILTNPSVDATLRYEYRHDIPNPIWGLYNGNYAYTPPQTPPSPSLMITRPEVIFRQYVHDYIAIAGTYPCSPTLDINAYFPLIDPILNARLRHQPTVGLCQVHRPVTSLTFGQIKVGHVVGSEEGSLPHALFSITVTYSDGEQFTSEIVFGAMSYQRYFFTSYLYLNCWDSVETDTFYTDQPVATIPHGAVFYDTARGTGICRL